MKIPLHISLVVAMLLAALGASECQAQQPDYAAAPPEAQGWAFTHLDLDLVIDPVKGQLTGDGTATLRLHSRQSPFLIIVLGETSSFSSFEHAQEIPGSVDLTERTATIYFDDPVPQGTEVAVRFGFVSRNRAYQFVIDDSGAAVSWVTGWYPCPSDGNHKAPGTTRLNLPRDWRALSNGHLADPNTEGDRRIETWHTDVPLARSFAAGPYYVDEQEVDGREISVYLLREDASRAAAYIVEMAQCLAALESRFGPLPYDGYALAEVPDSLVSWSGSSEQGFFMVRSALLGDKEAFVPLVAHEMAHSWWGNHVGWRRPGSFMVSEGLAQYGAVLTVEEIEGQTAATELLRFGRRGPGVGKSAKGYFWLQWKRQDEPLMSSTRGGEEIGHALANAKGPWIYHMLRQRVGDELFFRTLQRLVDQYGGGSMSLADLRRAFTDSAPTECRLETFFAQWMDRAGAPRLDLEWSDVSHEEAHKVQIIIRQRALPYELDLDIAVDSREDTIIHTVRLSQAEQAFVLGAAGKPTGIRLDPYHRLLMWRPEYAPGGFWLYPVGRLLLWQVGLIFILGLLAGLAQSLTLGMGLFSRHDTLPVVRELLVGLVAVASSLWLGWWSLGIAALFSILLYLYRQKRITEYARSTLGHRS